MIAWLKRLFAKRKPRELLCASYPHADTLLRKNEGWRLAPEEDRNTIPGVVWIERDVSNG